jgi:hypothetical protein
LTFIELFPIKSVNPSKPMMKPLCLSPLPAHRADEKSTLLLMEREGFVDEAVVTALVTRGHLGRSVADPDDLALAADDLDFAGWRLSKSVTVRSAEVPPQVIDAIVRRALPPVIGEPRCGSRPSASHRWWLTGLAGLLIFPMVVLMLPSHLGIKFDALLSPRIMTTTEPVPLKNDEPLKGSSELTEVSRIGR